MLLVFGFAASAFALHTDIPSEDTTPAVAAGTTAITISGEIRERYDLRSVYFNNEIPQYLRADSRIRLGIDAKVSPNTEGFIMLESTNADSTQTSALDQNYWGAGATDKATSGNAYNQSAGNGGFGGKVGGTSLLGNEPKGLMGIREAWIMYQGTGLLGFNAGLKVGHMPLKLGNGIWFDHTYYGDDALLLFANPVKELEVDLLVDKLAGTSVNLSNNTNAYVFAATYKPDKVSSIGFDMTYVDVQNMGDTASSFETVPVPQSPGDFAGPIDASTTGEPSIHLWNFGLRGNTELAGIGMYIDGEIQTGSEDMSGQPLNSKNLVGGTSNLDFSGKALKAGLRYTLNPVKLNLEYAYGSGDSGSNNGKYKTFVTTMGPDQHFSYVYDYRTINAAGNAYGGLQNTWYLKLGGNADITKDLNADVNLYYLRAANALTANNVANIYGSAEGGATGTGFRLTSTGVPYSTSTNIGTELDAKLTYKLDKGLQLWVEGGYLWAGDFWKNFYTVVDAGKTTIDNIYTVREGIQLNF